MKNLFSFLHERPQTIALVLSLCGCRSGGDRDQRTAQREADQSGRVCGKDGALPDAIKIVESTLKKRFENILTTDYTTIGGIDYIAERYESYGSWK